MEDMAEFADAEIQRYRKKIWIIFQDYQLISSLSPKDNVIYPLMLDQVHLAAIKKKYDAISSLLELSVIETKDIERLSGGEKQKIAMARALIHAPDFVIADEPTGNLDQEATFQIADILMRANQMGNTIVLITHDLQLLDYIQRQVAVKHIQLW